MTAASIGAIAIAFPVGEPLPPRPPLPLPRRWKVEGTIDSFAPEQDEFRVPRWTGSEEEWLGAEHNCRSAYGDGARVELRDGHASCCPTNEMPFGLCHSLTFKQD